MSLPSQVDKFNTNVDRVVQLVNGDKNSTVPTDNGPLPTIAKLLTDIQAAADVETEKLYQVVNGAANITVSTDNGPVPSLSKLVADSQALVRDAVLNQLDLAPRLAAAGGAQMVTTSSGQSVDTALQAVTQLANQLGAAVARIAYDAAADKTTIGAGTASVKNLVVSGKTRFGDAISWYAAVMSIKYGALGSPAMVFKPTDHTKDTSVFNFLSNATTDNAGVTMASLEHTANDAGINLNGTWFLNKAALLSVKGGTMTGALDFAGYQVKNSVSVGGRLKYKDLGIAAAGSVQSLDYAVAHHYRVQVGGPTTITLTNLQGGETSVALLELVNGAAFAAIWGNTINWVKNDGSGDTTPTFTAAGYTLHSAGTDWILFWLTNTGAINGKVMR